MLPVLKKFILGNAWSLLVVIFILLLPNFFIEVSFRTTWVFVFIFSHSDTPFSNEPLVIKFVIVYGAYVIFTSFETTLVTLAPVDAVQYTVTFPI